VAVRCRGGQWYGACNVVSSLPLHAHACVLLPCLAPACGSAVAGASLCACSRADGRRPTFTSFMSTLRGYGVKMCCCVAGEASEAPSTGALVAAESLESLPVMLDKFALHAVATRSISVLHIVVDPSPYVSAAAERFPVRAAHTPDGLSDSHRELRAVRDPHTQAEKAFLETTITKVVQASSERLRTLGVGQVAFLCVSAGGDVLRVGFRWSESDTSYARVPMLSFIEPPTACMLETDTLPSVQQYVPSYAHQLHTFVAEVRPNQPCVCMEKKKLCVHACASVPVGHSTCMSASMRF
jgi:Acetyl-CoA carboxylase, central region